MEIKQPASVSPYIIQQAHMYTISRIRSKRPKVHVPRLNRRWKLLKEAKEMARAGKLKREMKAKNMKLYMLNQIIVEENENLRRKATILLQENKILRSQFQKFPYPDSNTIRH